MPRTRHIKGSDIFALSTAYKRLSAAEETAYKNAAGKENYGIFERLFAGGHLRQGHHGAFRTRRQSQAAKGEMHIYNFGGIQLHAYKTNDFMDDEVFIIEKDEKQQVRLRLH